MRVRTTCVLWIRRHHSWIILLINRTRQLTSSFWTQIYIHFPKAIQITSLAGAFRCETPQASAEARGKKGRWQRLRWRKDLPLERVMTTKGQGLHGLRRRRHVRYTGGKPTRLLGFLGVLQDFWALCSGKGNYH